jgi:hypothetical protein
LHSTGQKIEGGWLQPLHADPCCAIVMHATPILISCSYACIRS